MERKLASVQKIANLSPIEGADSIEKATVLGWELVVKKGEFKVGDFCIYYEIDSLLPVVSQYEFLAKNGTKKMLVDGKEVEGYRLKTVKLRGQISQGLALPLSSFPDLVDFFKKANQPGRQVDEYTVIGENAEMVIEGADVTEFLGIIKYEAPVPASLTGIMKGSFPSFIPKTDEERIQSNPELLEFFKGVQVYITEKLDGSSFTAFVNNKEFGVCSRNLELLENEGNTYWKIARDYDIETKLRATGRNMAIQGEIVGEGIQGNPLKIKGQKLFIYSMFDIDSQMYFDFREMLMFCGVLKLEHVPIFESAIDLMFDVDTLLEMAKGKSELNPDTDMEGIVVRSTGLLEYTNESGDVKVGRLSFKVISPEYLLSHD